MGYLRLLLSLGVLGAHAGVVSEATSRTMVSCFFLVSGFLMALTLDRNYGRNPFPFYWNRILRLYPLHLLISVTILGLLPAYAWSRLTTSEGVNWGRLGRSLLLLFPDAGTLNGPAWTLPYELTFYGLAPFIAFWGIVGFVIYAVAGIVLFLTFKGGSPLGPFAWGESFLPSLPSLAAASVFFGLGGVAYSLHQRLSGQSFHRFFFLFANVAVCLLIVASSRFFNDTWTQFDEAYGALAAHGLALLVLCFLITWSKKEAPFARLCGDLCYPVYLIHWPIFQVWFDGHSWPSSTFRDYARIFSNGDYVVKLLVGTVLTFVLAWLWIFLEKKTIQRWRAAQTQTGLVTVAASERLPA